MAAEVKECKDINNCINPTEDLHPCPYQEEVENNKEPYCNCCPLHTKACGDNV